MPFDFLFDKLREKEKRHLIAKLFKEGEAKSTPSSKVYKWILEHREVTITLLILIVVAKITIAIQMYNIFVNLKQEVETARADIGGCLQMRENLIPQLVATMSDFVQHEDIIFLESANVRVNSINPKLPVGQSAESHQGEAGTGKEQTFLSKLFAVAEQYPELKTSESFQILMSKAADVEKEILSKRINYNAKALNLNKRVTSFPDKLYAILYGFKQVKYFQWKGKPEWVSQRVIGSR